MSLLVWFNETLSNALYTTPAEMGLMLEFTVLLFQRWPSRGNENWVRWNSSW